MAKENQMFALEVQTLNDSIFVHLASSIEKAVEWVKKFGNNWFNEDYCFIIYAVELDKDDYAEQRMDDMHYIDIRGNITETNPLLKE